MPKLATKIKTYYELAKPGIIYGNALTAVAGFFLAVAGLKSGIYGNGVTSWPHLIALLISMLVGLSLVIGGSCVFNNYYDRHIDTKMERTKGRALVTGAVSSTAALIYASCLLVLGTVILCIWTNPLTMLMALLGAFFYILLYTPLKHRTDHSALVGAIAGATPPIVGLCAVTGSLAGRLGLEGVLLFLILVFWQMPHFYAIAMYRAGDYAVADIPTLPQVRGTQVAKIAILSYIIAFMLATVSLTVFGFTGWVYLAVVLVLGVVWLWICARGFRRTRIMTDAENIPWAKHVFLFSLVVIMVLSVMLAVGGLIK